MAIGAEPTPRQLPAPTVQDGDFLRLGVEEEFHVVDLPSRELVAQAPTILEGLPDETYSDELQRSVVESNSPVCTELTALRESLVASRRLLVETAGAHDLGVVAAGTVPLVDPLRLAVTPSVRYERMLADYQLLVREQLICGAQVHVQVSDRDLAVAIAQRVTPHLPVLLALSASSPFWMGEDTGYASTRSLLWQRWPTAGLSGEISTAAEHDALVADLVASGTISDPGMIYFDVRPSAHVPTLELRVPDACPDVDDVVLLAGCSGRSSGANATPSSPGPPSSGGLRRCCGARCGGRPAPGSRTRCSTCRARRVRCPRPPPCAPCWRTCGSRWRRPATGRS